MNQLFASIGSAFAEGAGVCRVLNTGQPAQACGAPSVRDDYQDDYRRQHCADQENWRADQHMAKLNPDCPRVNFLQLRAKLMILTLFPLGVESAGRRQPARRPVRIDRLLQLFETCRHALRFDASNPAGHFPDHLPSRFRIIQPCRRTLPVRPLTARHFVFHRACSIATFCS